MDSGAGQWNRWPLVTRPDSMPNKAMGIVSASIIATIQCTGRTNSKSLLAHRMRLGTGKAASEARTTSGRISIVLLPSSMPLYTR